MSNATLFSRSEVKDILQKSKAYRKEKIKPSLIVTYDTVQKLIGKSKSNEKFERAKFSIFDSEDNEYIVILQKVIEDDFDSFSGSLLLKTAKEEVFLCRLDYNDEHPRKCKREQFEKMKTDKFHLHLHCKECYEIMGKDGLENIAFTIETDDGILHFIDFLKMFFEKISLETAKNFASLQMEMHYDS